MDSVYEDDLGGTFSGNPLSCVPALKVIEIMKIKNLQKNF